MHSTDLLNRLLTIHCRSFAMYISQTGMWQNDSQFDAETARVLRAVVADQEATAARLAELITSRHEPIRMGGFPMEFTDKNDLSLDYLVGELCATARSDQAAIEQILFALPTSDAAAREAAQEALGAAKAHVEAFEAAAAKQPA